MNIPIYPDEVNDGLAEQIKNNSVAYVAAASPATAPVEQVDSYKLQKILAQNISDNQIAIAENKDQIDLYYIKSVLVSTGWNKNDDVFDPQELWDARDTPEDKPFNFMHDEKDIIGHITANEVVDFEGNPIDSSVEVAPKEFNILTSAVIYTEWSDIEQKQRLTQIVAEIEENKWFVSMECLFPNFDYALKNAKGETKVVKRDEASAFLTKHLRSYGGTGKYDDYQVGRLLRNLSFSGKGLVSKPANPRSIILEGNDFFDESQSKLLTLSSLKEKNSMSDQDTQVKSLRAELAEAKAANEALKEKAEKEAKAGYENQIAELEAKIEAQAAEVEAVKASLTEKTEAFDALTVAKTELEESAEAMKKEVEAMKKKEAMMKREAELAEAGFDTEEAKATVAEFENLADEDFARVVALVKRSGMKKEAMKDSEAGMPPELKEAIEKKKKEKEAKAESDEDDSALASEELLENAETPQETAVAQINSQPEDEAETLRSSASEWIGSILKSNN
jgi:hypothetical protein